MTTGRMDLERIIDISKWQSLQDSIAQVTELAIITVDYKGIPITEYSQRREFCDYIRTCPQSEKYCHKCDSRAGLEAVRINSPYIYLCHCNIVNMAVPIIVDEMYLGAIMAGQVRLPKSDVDTELELILISPLKNILEEQKMRKTYWEIPIMPIERIRVAAKMLHELCNYIVGEAISKNLILEIYGRTGKGTGYRNGDGTFNFPTENIEKVRKAMGRAITGAYVKATSEDNFVCKNPTIRPAFEYIYQNKNDSISQKQMAEICHISTSHFSRLFSKETGESFSNFLARLKVEWAKQLLEKTDLSVTLVSDELGFSEPSYFIKTFKKFEKTTPAVYRKYYREMK